MLKPPVFRIKCLIFLIALIPLALLIENIIANNLGANPVEKLAQETGLWSLRFLLITLSISPVRMIFKKPGITKYRRMLGLFTFFYSSIHLAIYIVLEHSLTWAFIEEDIITSLSVDFGIAAYCLLIPLTFTSTNKMIKRLGKKWKKLHNLVHFVAFLAIIHYAFSEKADLKNPLVYGLIFLGLLLIKTLLRTKKRFKSSC